MKTLEQLRFNNSYARLPDEFHTRLQTAPLSGQFLVSVNEMACRLIGLDPAESRRTDFVDIITGKQPLAGYEPLAMCYSGHQFGSYVPRLGDGRAILLGQLVTDEGDKWDLQLKGAGRTPYSRDGDGRAVLRSTIREYLCSEAMHGLGIPTTRSLCMIGSSEEVYRENIETGAMLLRMAPSHIRFGTFEYFYYTNQHEQLRVLADYVIGEHYADLQQEKNPCLQLLRHAVRSTAILIAEWQAVGFSHGVMNTDNMSIHGITIDYGPYGFLDQYRPDFICNHSDHRGRYAFNRQPDIGAFNLSCLAQALLPLIDEEPQAAAELALEELNHYQHHFVEHYAGLMRAKLGLQERRHNDRELCDGLLQLMQEDRVDYTILFRSLSEVDSVAVRDQFLQREAFDQWHHQYRQRLFSEGGDAESRSVRMKGVNPRYILRNYMAESAIRKATENRDYSEIDRLLTLLQRPYDEQPENREYAGYPPAWAQHIEVSCSS